MSIKQTEKRAAVIRIGKGNIIARKTMSHCARVTRRKKGKQSCKYNKNNVVPLGNCRIHVVGLEENPESDGWTSGPSSVFGREASGTFRVDLGGNLFRLGMVMNFAGLGMTRILTGFGRVRFFTGLSMARVLTGLVRVRYFTGLGMAGVLTGLGRAMFLNGLGRARFLSRIGRTMSLAGWARTWFLTWLGMIRL